MLLADRDCAIVDRRLGQRQLSTMLDRVLAVPGVRYVEDSTGTNSLATAFELHKPIAVAGEEHFLESLKAFCCYGAPIIDPVTHRLEGVLDVTGPAGENTSLLGPFVRRAAREIEMRLFEAARTVERQLMTTFHEHARSKRHALLVLSPTVILSNPTAADLLAVDDHTRLHALTDGLHRPLKVVESLTLNSGREVDVHAQSIVGTDGVLYELIPRSDPKVVRKERLRTARRPDASALVIGEPGTGRTRLAVALAGPEAPLLSCLESLTINTWLRDTLAMLVHGSDQTVVLDDVHLLERREVAALTTALHASAARVIVTSAPVTDASPDFAALLSVVTDRHELRPLRHYGADFPDLAVSVLDELFGSHSLRIASAAMRTLMAQLWPGNIVELRAALAASVGERRVGDILVTDLPAYLAAGGSPARTLTPLEAAERDAIVKALTDSGGNKSSTAAALGIGRTTLYHRLRYFNLAR